jgi:Trypsin
MFSLLRRPAQRRSRPRLRYGRGGSVRLVIVMEELEDRIAPVVGSLQRATPVQVGISDPVTGGSSGIVQVITSESSGTGELLATGRDILTAAHIVTDDAGNLVTGNIQIIFEQPQKFTYTVPNTAITLAPGWTGMAQMGNDLAIIALPSPAPATAARYSLYTATDEVTQNFVIDGFGQTGTGDKGSTDPKFFASYGTLRAAYNRYDGTNAIFGMAPVRPIPANTPLPLPSFPANSALVYDFDNGNPNNDALGYYYGVNNTGVVGIGGAFGQEGFAAPGDSGGAGFIGSALASIVSYGFGFPANPPDFLPGTNDTFGEIEVDTRVSAFANWINSVIYANRLQVTVPAAVTAGTPFSFTVTAVNALGMVIPGFTDTVHFTSSDTAFGVDLPVDYTFVPGDNGRHTFPVAGTETTLITGGVTYNASGLAVPITQSITATDTAVATVRGIGTTVVNAATVDHFTLIPQDQSQNPRPLPIVVAGPPIVLGTVGTTRPDPIAVLAVDRFGNTNPNFVDTVAITSSDPAAVLPPDADFTAEDAGRHLFNVTFKTAGNRTVTATDVEDDAIRNTSDLIRVVNAGTAVRFDVNTPTNTIAGQAFTTTVQAIDVFGGIATNYTGRVHFTTTDPNAGAGCCQPTTRSPGRA